MAARKALRNVGSVGKAARSAVRRAGESSMVPRRVMRRPAWSAYTFSGSLGIGKLIQRVK